MIPLKLKAWHKYTRSIIDVTMIDFLLDAYRGRAGFSSGSGHLADIELLPCTGLTDSAGRDIYQHDIVYRSDIDVRATVIWLKDRAAFLFLGNDGEVGYAPSSGDWEVIGNVYENPELASPNWERIKQVYEQAKSTKGEEAHYDRH